MVNMITAGLKQIMVGVGAGFFASVMFGRPAEELVSHSRCVLRTKAGCGFGCDFYSFLRSLVLHILTSPV